MRFWTSLGEIGSPLHYLLEIMLNVDKFNITKLNQVTGGR